jgi:hypothetical protein
VGHRVLAAAIAAVSFLGSGTYVLAHPKNDAAPLQPPAASVVVDKVSAPPSTAPSGKTAAPRATARITLQPGVRATDLPGISYTHVS